ncbi:MAG TPA: nickel insertion protein, partial [archaeon]|nr:nickel insertion protein [archaeon]
KQAMESVNEFVRGCKKVEVKVDEANSAGITGKRVDVIINEEYDYRTGTEIEEAVKLSAKNLKLQRNAVEFAVNSIKTLLKAEMKVHGEKIGKLRLYEVGSADTVADMIGVVVALNDLGFLKNTTIYSTPVAVGSGKIKFADEVTTVPAPATAEILKSRGFPIVRGPLKMELTTPTGASILVNLTGAFTKFSPSMKFKSVGCGLGSRKFRGAQNALRIGIC